MKKIKILLLFLLFSGISWQCENVDESIYNDVVNNTSQEKLNALFDEALISEKAFAHFDASNPNFVYTTPRGTTVTVNGTCLRLNGAPVTGTVILEFIELFDRAKMTATNKPTMGLKPNSEKEMLLSGGEFYVNVTKNGQNLTTTCNIVIETPTSNSGGTVTGMQAFNGIITNNQLTWEPANNWEVFTNTQKNTYNLSIPGFGWFNCDKFYNYPEPKTTITANVPTGYADKSQIFLLTKNVPNAMGTISGKYPVGLDCYLIFVTENNGNYMWITKEQKLTANHTVTFDLKDAIVGKRGDYVGHVTLLK